MIINFKHLAEVEEGYFAHLRYNLWVSVMVLFLAVVSLVHAFLPFLFPRWPQAIRKYMMKESLNRDRQVSKALRKKGLSDV